MAGIDFKAVSDALTCEEFARSELKTFRNGRAACPFHGGTHGNLAFMKDGRCYCHVCHKAADTVQLAAATWNVPQLDAARELNQRFHLAIPDGEKLTADDLRRRDEARQRERDRRRAEEQAERDRWSQAADDLREAEAAAERLTIADADKPGTWTIIARYVKAISTWEALQAGW